MSLSKARYPLLSTSSTHVDPSQHYLKSVDWDVKNENKQSESHTICLCPIYYDTRDNRSPCKECVDKKLICHFQPKHVMGIQKNRLNETVLLSIQNTCLN